MANKTEVGKLTIFDWQFWVTLAFGVLWICGVWTAFKPEMIFGWLGDNVEAFMKAWWGHETAEYVAKPLFRCPPCMSSLHGSYVWLIAGGDWWMLVPFIVCLCGSCSLIFLVFQDE